MANQSKIFGTGTVFFITPDTVAQVIEVGVLKEISVDFAQDSVKLHGAGEWPLAVAGGKRSITGKAKAATFQGNLMAAVLNGTVTAYQGPVVTDSGTIPTTPYQVTATSGASGTVDLGVTIDGAIATRISGTPATGQYSFASGVYTFASADAAKAYVIKSKTSASQTGGITITGGNANMGTSGTYQLVLSEVDAETGKKITLTLPAVKFLGASFSLSTEDFSMPDLSFEAFYSSTAGYPYKWEISA